MRLLRLDYLRSLLPGDDIGGFIPHDGGTDWKEVQMHTFLTTMARWGDAGWSGGWGGPWWIVVPLLWVVLAGVAVWLFARRRNAPVVQGANAVEILAARYARGEIETDEYRQRLDELKGLR